MTPEQTRTPQFQIDLCERVGIRHVVDTDRASRTRKGVVVSPTYRMPDGGKRWYVYVGGRFVGGIQYHPRAGYRAVDPAESRRLPSTLAGAVFFLVSDYLMQHGSAPWKSIHAMDPSEIFDLTD